MDEGIAWVKQELRVSVGPVIVAYVLAGTLLFVLGDSLPDSPSRRALLDLSVSSVAAAAILALLYSWKPECARWFAVAVTASLVYAVGAVLGTSAAYALVVIPVLLGGTLVSSRAALLGAVGQTLLLFLLPADSAGGKSGVTVAVALIAVWLTLAVVYAVCRAVYQVADWLHEYSVRVQALLVRAQERKVELEQAMESLANANRQLALAAERMAALRTLAEQAEKAKATFVANVSHELRTPLNMILGLVELMMESPQSYCVVLSPEMREDLEVVRRNCEHLSQLVTDVLDLSRAEVGSLGLSRDWADLGQVIRDSVAVVYPLLRKKHLALDIVVPDDLPRVYCDRTRIRQVVLNLLSNAARFTEAGGITVEAMRSGEHIVVTVTDTGPGIPLEDVDKVFEPFYQPVDGAGFEKGGSGLGLSISKRYIELHSGRMWVDSRLGVGSSFSFSLPLEKPREHQSHPWHMIREDWIWREGAFRTERATSTDQLLKPRIVVCDTSSTLSRELTRLAEDVEFVDAENLTQATQALEQGPAHAVLLNTDGLDALWRSVKVIRQQEPETPVIACSVFSPVQRALDAGALGYLVKPVTHADLERTIRGIGIPVRRVLVVDDDADVLQLLTRMLRACDVTLEILTAPSGTQALELLRTAPVDLMLLDVVMPGMSGWQVLERLREMKQEVPTVLVSARDPCGQPLTSDFVLVTTGRGLSLQELLRFTQVASAFLLRPEKGPGPELV